MNRAAVVLKMNRAAVVMKMNRAMGVTTMNPKVVMVETPPAPAKTFLTIYSLSIQLPRRSPR